MHCFAGERPLWFVEKFEARRRELLEQQQAAPQQVAQPAQAQPAAAASSGDDALQPPADAPSPTTTPQRALSAVAVALQALQLAAVVGALILWPAAVISGGLSRPRIWVVALAYLVFFGQGSVRRVLRHGRLAARSADKQGATLASRIAWLAFVITVPLLHWMAVHRFVSMSPPPAAALTLYDALGFSLIAAGTFINNWAAGALGAAYDRIVAPERLVTTGPYALVQHPIYTSYMLLFAGFCLALHSAPAALAMVAVCWAYYLGRTRLEGSVLEAAFGEAYRQYRSRTGRFVPGLM